MEEINEKVKLLKENWIKVLGLSINNLAQWQAHVKYTTPIQIDEVVKTIINLLDRIRSPKGFEPNFHLAKNLAASTLQQNITYLQNISAGQWGHLPNFINGLIQMLACFHNLIVFSDKKQMRDSIAELGDKLAQALALVDTAQGEMRNKIEVLEKAENIAERIEERVDEIEKIKTSSDNSLEAIQENQEEATKILNSVKVEVKESEELKKALAEQIVKSNKLQKDLEEQQLKVDDILNTATSQQQTINDLLRSATSAGLAHSFRHRLLNLNNTKYTWLSLFLFSIAGLIGIGIWIFNTHTSNPADIWQGILERLPLTAPLIWLGWVSAIQYGNVIRVQEDYAFKEATSKAFEGYRDHMEHLKSVSDESSKTALDLLSKSTIEILSRSPLRIYRKSEDDVSFWSSFFNKKKKSKIPEEE